MYSWKGAEIILGKLFLKNLSAYLNSVEQRLLELNILHFVNINTILLIEIQISVIV